MTDKRGGYYAGGVAGLFGWPITPGGGLYADTEGNFYPQLYLGTPGRSFSSGYTTDLESFLVGPSVAASLPGAGTWRYNIGGNQSSFAGGIGTPGFGFTYGFGPVNVGAIPRYLDDRVNPAWYPDRTNEHLSAEDRRSLNRFYDENPQFPWCFPAGTLIRLANATETPIEAIRPGDVVAAFDGAAEWDCADLKRARVARLYSNITTEWLVLSNGLTVTPGHHVLNEHGAFERIDALVARSGRVVRADGSLEAVTAERVVYSDATRHLYEEAEEAVYASEGGAALKPEIRRGWRTYNFEVEGLHSYVAGGVRVHNRSDNLEAYATLMDHARSRPLGYRGMADEYGSDVARATARGMDPHLALILAECGLLGRVPPAPAPTPLQRVLGLPADDRAPAPTPLQQVLGLPGDVHAPAHRPSPLRQVLGLDPI